MTDNATKAAAALLGRKGGSARTPAKVKAAQANGARGGRPAQIPASVFLAIPVEAMPSARPTDEDWEARHAWEAIRRADAGATDADLSGEGLPTLAEVRVSSSRWTGERSVKRG